MPPVHGIGQPQHGSQLGDDHGQVLRRSQPRASHLVLVALHLIVLERKHLVTDHIGHQLPLQVGQTDNLCGHDDIVSPIRSVPHGDKLAAGMKHCRDPQQQTFPIPQAMIFLQTVKNLESFRLHGLDVGHMAFVPFGHVAGGDDDVIVKIMMKFQELFFLGVLCRYAVLDPNAGNPQHLGAGQLKHPLQDSSGRKQQGGVLSIDIKGLLDLI